MLKIKVPTMYEIEQTRKRKRNKFIILIIVLLNGIACVNNGNTVFLSPGWFMIATSIFAILIYYILPGCVDLLLGTIGVLLYKKKHKQTHFHIVQEDKQKEQ